MASRFALIVPFILAALNRVEQFAHLHAERQTDAIEGFDGRGVLTQFNLAEVTERDAGAVAHVRQCQVHRLAAFANRGTERFLERVFGHPQQSLAFQTTINNLAKLFDLERLGEVIASLGTETVDRTIDRWITGDDNNGRVGLAVANPTEDLLCLQAGENVIEDNQVIVGWARERE